MTALPPALHSALRAPEVLIVAVSGGVDSLCLSAAAQVARAGAGLRLVHAVSPAVPQAATTRVQRFAAERGLDLALIASGEFEDPRYRANPVDRCYYCKTHLYGTLADLAQQGAVAAGTNLDDLGDFRPGLRAAAERGVIHPFVDAAMTKADVRALARALGLQEIAELPAAPCLASRIETGLRVEPADLAMIDAVEEALRADLGAVTLRCRRTHAGLAVELDAAILAGLSADRQQALSALARAACLPHGGGDLPLTLRPYRQGSAFLHD
ncbi:adenine nucleotide alpha hydrolase [Salipiger marinus]|uniref:Adenine nucleotide alpha hydrolase n=1 Tax=Salipiger marinus TaxID=555512 RepID=A0A1G8KDJ6_9RHOB|nr:adenine nucleotide alpha hydrolase [Salipiger marinus]SDI41481.1 uncharacterized protein SAMN04487993_1004186 [Salipiger marinus]